MYSILIPVYNNEQSIEPLVAAIGVVIEKVLIEKSGRAQAVFIIDGSPDNSEQKLTECLGDCGYPATILTHSRNFGAFAAIRTGLSEVDSDYYAVIAADLQEPPELLLEFYEQLSQSDADIIVGVREGRDDPAVSKLLSGLFWGFYRRFVVKNVPKGGVDIFACSRSVRDQLVTMSESNSSLIAQLFWVGFRRAEVPYRRSAREHGKSGWTLNKKLKYLRDSIYSFTDFPIRLVSMVGIATMLGSAAYGIAVVAARLTGLIQDAGFTSIIVAILFFGGLNAFSIGVVGTYAWRTFENTKARPLSIVARRREFSGAGSK